MENKIGERIKKLRKLYKLTQHDLAKKISVDPTAISGYERGVRSPSRINAEKMADLFGVTVDYILARSDNMVDIGENSRPVIEIPTKHVPLFERLKADQEIPALEDAQEIFPVSVDSSADFALKVKDDSMAPKINKANVILVQSKSELKDGDIGIISVDKADAICRKYHRHENIVILRALNEKYDDTVIALKKWNRRCRVFGIVVAKFEYI